jgi:hypothetical protein
MDAAQQITCDSGAAEDLSRIAAEQVLRRPDSRILPDLGSRLRECLSRRTPVARQRGAPGLPEAS